MFWFSISGRKVGIWCFKAALLESGSMDSRVLEERQSLPVPGHVKATTAAGPRWGRHGPLMGSVFTLQPGWGRAPNAHFPPEILTPVFPCSGARAEMMFHILKINTAFPEASMQPQSSRHSSASRPLCEALMLLVCHELCW